MDNRPAARIGDTAKYGHPRESAQRAPMTECRASRARVTARRCPGGVVLQFDVATRISASPPTPMIAASDGRQSPPQLGGERRQATDRQLPGPGRQRRTPWEVRRGWWDQRNHERCDCDDSGTTKVRILRRWGFGTRAGPRGEQTTPCRSSRPKPPDRTAPRRRGTSNAHTARAAWKRVQVIDAFCANQ